MLGKIPINKSVLKTLFSQLSKQVRSKKKYYPGFQLDLNYSGPRIHLECSNLVSAHHHPQETIDQINSEVKLGRTGGLIKDCLSLIQENHQKELSLKMTNQGGVSLHICQ